MDPHALSRNAPLAPVSVIGADEGAPRESASGARLLREIGLWQSPRMRELWRIVQEVAQVDITVLIGGETGTGKDVVARAIHHLSRRRGGSFVKVNCAAVPRELLESELFGHEKGAFTGAHQQKPGKFELADRGTMLLDEIGELHPPLQAKLLHVVQDGSFSRVGGRSALHSDVRVLAATNLDLERAVAAGQFREDLYYRLNVIHIQVPPLRERMEEVPLLADYFARRYAKAFNRDGFRLTPEAMAGLSRHRYPGNIRELENIVKRMIVLGDPDLDRAAFPDRAGAVAPERHAESPRAAAAAPTPGEPAIVPLKEVARMAARAAEREAIARVLQETRWNRVRAAKLLCISYRALLYKIKDVGLDQPLASAPWSGGSR